MYSYPCTYEWLVSVLFACCIDKVSLSVMPRCFLQVYRRNCTQEHITSLNSYVQPYDNQLCENRRPSVIPVAKNVGQYLKTSYKMYWKIWPKAFCIGEYISVALFYRSLELSIILTWRQIRVPVRRKNLIAPSHSVSFTEARFWSGVNGEIII